MLFKRYTGTSGEEFGFKPKHYGKLWESLKQGVAWSGLHFNAIILAALRIMDCRGCKSREAC